MPYVRERGNHLAIVHGARHPTTKKVEQQVLFTIHSKEEARAAIDGSSQRLGGRSLRHLLEVRYPGIRFEWDELCRSLDEMKSCLPDTAPPRENHVFRDFRENLLGFARQLAFADPQSLTSARDLLAAQRVELTWVAELLRWRLDMLAHARDNEFTHDPFGWALALRRPEVPGELEEMAAESWEKGDLDTSEKIFGLLVEAFPSYAEGWNYLGLIALRRGEHDSAIEQFERTIRIGRTLFPKRIPKSDYWLNLATRPYMRGLTNIATAFTRAGRYDDALAAAQRIEAECGDQETARRHRLLVFLNRGDWDLVKEEGLPIPERDTNDSLLAGLAAVEREEIPLARTELVTAILGAPRTVAVVLDFRTTEPQTFPETEDHNQGVELCASLASYLTKRNAKSKRFTRQLWQHPLLDSLRHEIETLERKRMVVTNSDRRSFERLTEIRSRAFAERTAETIATERTTKGTRR